MKKEIYLITLLLLTLFSFINLWSAEEPETKRIKWGEVLAEESEIKWKRWDRVVTFNKVEFYHSDSEPFSIYQERNQLFIDTREKNI
ncbi:MAG: hypothetical protein PHR06_08885 [Candidatus Cloacimonetes bacterium]|nr:hypothetical protein [Candidatus Cloacimonadota bacterium]